MASKMEKRVERAAALAKTMRERAKQAARAQQHTLVAVGSAYAIGAAEKRQMELPSIDGVDPKLLYGAAALAVGFVVKDQQFRRIGQSVGDGLLSIVAYNQGKGISAIGGDDEMQ